MRNQKRFCRRLYNKTDFYTKWIDLQLISMKYHQNTTKNNIYLTLFKTIWSFTQIIIYLRFNPNVLEKKRVCFMNTHLRLESRGGWYHQAFSWFSCWFRGILKAPKHDLTSPTRGRLDTSSYFTGSWCCIFQRFLMLLSP